MVILNNSKGESVKTAEEREYSCAADGEEGINTQNEMQLTVCQPHPNPLQIFNLQFKHAIQKSLATRRSQSSHNPSENLLADNQMHLPKLQSQNFDGNILNEGVATAIVYQKVEMNLLTASCISE